MPDQHPRETQARTMAHLRPLPRCRCGRPATEELFSGMNAKVGAFCSAHAKGALARFKRGENP